MVKPTINHKSVIIFLFNDQKVLLQLRPNSPKVQKPNIWFPIGGKIEKGEKPKQAAIREVFEETGYKIEKLYRFLSTVSLTELGVSQTSFFVAKYDNRQTINCYEGQKMEFTDIKTAHKILKQVKPNGYFFASALTIATKLNTYSQN